MADRPMTSTSKAGTPRVRSRSVHLPTHIPIASKAVKPSAKKKPDKAVAVVSSDTEDLEVDFPHHTPNQPLGVPAEQPQEPNPPVNIPAKEPREPNHPLDILVEGTTTTCEHSSRGSRTTTGTKQPQPITRTATHADGK